MAASIAGLATLVGPLWGCGDAGAPGRHAPPAELIVPPMPAPADLRIQLPPDSFHSLDFMALGGCRLRRTLGKFQSSLGRRASHSQRLLLELEYLRLAPQCISHLQSRGKAGLGRTLEHIRARKQTQLPARIFNATLASSEFQQFWRGALQQAHPDYSRSALEAISAAARRWLGGDYRASNIEFEVQLSDVSRGSIAQPEQIGARQAIIDLEGLLRPVLPPSYLSWAARRRTHFTRLAQPTGINLPDQGQL